MARLTTKELIQILDDEEKKKSLKLTETQKIRRQIYRKLFSIENISEEIDFDFEDILKAIKNGITVRKCYDVEGKVKTFGIPTKASTVVLDYIKDDFYKDSPIYKSWVFDVVFEDQAYYVKLSENGKDWFFLKNKVVSKK